MNVSIAGSADPVQEGGDERVPLRRGERPDRPANVLERHHLVRTVANYRSDALQRPQAH